MKVFDHRLYTAAARHFEPCVMLAVINLKVDKILICQRDLLYVFSFMLV
jgi:hypothetical protein